MSKASKLTAEDLLKKLRRLDANMNCPNCDSKASQGIGFGNICVKFRTFVCDMCKTSHQAISHRVKSVSMSTWTMDEVRELMDENGGGNDAARHIWLANAPPCGSRYNGGHRPKEGDKIDYFKQFVVDCYEYGKFRSNSPYIPSGCHDDSTPVTNHKSQVNSHSNGTSPVSKSNRTKTSDKSNVTEGGKAPSVISVIDLLDEIQTVPVGADPFTVTSFSDASAFQFMDSSSQNKVTQAPVNVFTESHTSTLPTTVFDPFISSQGIDDFMNSTAATRATSATTVPEIPRTNSFNDLLLQPATDQPPSFHRTVSAGNMTSAPSSNFSDPFGNDILIPVVKPTATTPTPVTQVDLLSSLGPSSSRSSSSLLLSGPSSSSSASSSSASSSSVAFNQLNTPGLGIGSGRQNNNGLGMGIGMGSMNSGLAISSMAAFVPPQQSSGMGMGMMGARPPMTPPMGYPNYNTTNRVAMGNGPNNGRSPAYNSSSSYNNGSQQVAVGAFDFVDAELKASSKR